MSTVLRCIFKYFISQLQKKYPRSQMALREGKIVLKKRYFSCEKIIVKKSRKKGSTDRQTLIFII